MFSKKTFHSISFLKYFFIILLISSFTFSIPTTVQAGLFDGTPALVDKLNSAFEKIEDWLLKLATPAAAVAVAVGVFMKKFSFGDEERIRTAKKIIRGSLFSYGFILVLNLILSAIKSLLT
ncbi:MAG: hypothetical protein HFJ30_03825 [Clostridia bacterium]|jgi:hypothetical protein|nr:hypothetical protein [Clostridia bacterium]